MANKKFGYFFEPSSGGVVPKPIWGFIDFKLREAQFRGKEEVWRQTFWSHPQPEVRHTFVKRGALRDQRKRGALPGGSLVFNHPHVIIMGAGEKGGEGEGAQSPK